MNLRRRKDTQGHTIIGWPVYSNWRCCLFLRTPYLCLEASVSYADETSYLNLILGHWNIVLNLVKAAFAFYRAGWKTEWLQRWVWSLVAKNLNLLRTGWSGHDPLSCPEDISVLVLSKAGVQDDRHAHPGLFNLYLGHSAEEGREHILEMRTSKIESAIFKTRKDWCLRLPCLTPLMAT